MVMRQGIEDILRPITYGKKTTQKKTQKKMNAKKTKGKKIQQEKDW